MPPQMAFLDRAMALVVLQVEPNGSYLVAFMRLDEKGEIDFDEDDFVLVRTQTRDEASQYAIGLGKYLQIRVLEIRNTDP
jgi:hypothetical protein